MNYSPFWDAWFSSPWLSFGIPAAVFIAVIVIRLQLAGKKGSKNEDAPKTKSSKTRNGVSVFFMVVFVIAMMMINGHLKQSYFGFGKSKNIVKVQYIDGKLYAMDYLQTMGGKSTPGIKYYRLHVVDPATGKKQRRFVIGAGAKLLNVINGKAYVGHYGDLWSYDINTGKRVTKYNLKTLPKLFPEFAQGVDNIQVNNETLLITVECKDGRKRYLDPFTNIVTDVDPTPTPPNYTPSTGELYIDGSEIKKDANIEYLNIEAKYSDGKRAMIYNANDSVLYKDLSFLNGEPVVINNIDSSFVVLHFLTTENEQFILTCLKLDGSKMLWEIKQTSLNAKYRFRNYKENVSITDDGKGKMFFGIAGELYCINLKDGKILWKLHL